ncbi:acyl-CoA thioesterase/bile acid-CoA:amino acid N-acyltransferase family protein [Williamsia soli]|uniref:acyl-CoA thioesterase/bile acid-CoA:amino acid N-acyltransferase family protein n=1 Tax=Williamsia soli TaxID=364929 RepID=UPI001A9F3AE1|nr:acyl-CoA thioesterase/bile acid-CoA:amino acid N-acyltransferase family protein [Williamsia soli]
MGFVIGFAPWIVFWVLVGNAGFITAVLVSFGLTIAGQVFGRLRGAPFRTLEVGTVAVFAVLTIAALTLDENVLERWLQPLSNLGLFLIALVGVLVGRPFVREYAEGSVDEQTAASGGFTYITTAMTWMWVAAFGAMTVLSMIPPIVDGDATIKDDGDALSIVCYWVAPFTLLGLAGLVSSVFPNWFDARSKEVSAREAVDVPVAAAQPAPQPDVATSTLTITAPAESRHDEGFGLQITGADAGAAVTVTAGGVDLFGTHWSSRADFTASADGVVDVGVQAPDRGDWTDADPDAPLWAMSPDSTGDRVPELFVPPVGPWQVVLEATSADGLVRRTVLRSPWAPGVAISEVDIAGRPALLALPAGDPPEVGWPAVACFGGSEGGVDSQRVTIATLASNGVAALAYSWVDEESPDNPEAKLVDIPLERFGAAIDALARTPGVDAGRLTAMGISRGAEGLTAAATVSRLPIGGLVLVSPSSVSWQAIGPDGELPDAASWTFGGEPLSWTPLPTGSLMPQLIRNAWRVHRDIAHRTPSLLRLHAAYTAGLDAAGSGAARLPSELIDVPILCIAGSDDRLWPSSRMATELLAARSDPADELLELENAGHLIRLATLPATAQWTGGIAFGGTASGQGRAQRAATAAVLRFAVRVPV